MKKLLLGTMLLLSATLTTTNVKNVLAESTDAVTTEVINFVDNQHQINMGTFQKFAVTKNSAYYLNDDGLNIVDFNNNLSQTLIFNNVTDIKQTDNYVVILANNRLKVLKNNNAIDIAELNIDEVTAYNVFESNQSLFVSYAKADNSVQVIEIRNEQIVDRHTLKQSSDTIISICLNQNYTYVLTQNGSTYNMTKFNNSTTTPTTLSFTYLNVSNMEMLESNNNQYLVVTAKNNNSVVVLKENEGSFETIAEKDIFAIINTSFKLGEISSIADVKTFNGCIYIGDSLNKNIQSFELSGDKLVAKSVIVARNSFEKGYFNNAHDFYYIDDNNIYISDTDNNRIQMYNDEVTILDKVGDINLNKPKLITTNDNISFWIYSGNKIIKLYNDNITEYVTSSITDMKISKENNLYYLDLVEDSLKVINNGEYTPRVIVSDLNLNNDSKLLLLNDDTIAVSTNKAITIFDINDGSVVAGITLDDNIKSIDKDFYNNIYTLTTHNIVKIDNNNHTLTPTTPLTYEASNLNYLQINKVSGDIICYDNYNNRLLKIHSNYVKKVEDYQHIVDTSNYAPKQTIIQSGKLNTNTYITAYPYNTDIIRLLNTDTKVFILGEVDNSYYVMYNYNNIINYGYITKSNITIIDNNINEPKQMLVINKNIKLYKLPTILKDVNDINFAYTTVQLNTTLNVVNDTLISIDNSQYFAVKTEDNTILYVNASDVTSDLSSDISPLPDTNAVIINNQSDKVKLYTEADDSSYILLELDAGQKLCVKEYNAKEKYTYVSVITKNKTVISGYVETKYIKLTSNNPFMVSAYILLGVSIIIIITSVVVYISLNKKDVIE